MMKIGDKVRFFLSGAGGHLSEHEGSISAHEADRIVPWVVRSTDGVLRRFREWELEKVYTFKMGDSIDVTSGALIGMAGTISHHGRMFDWICKDSNGQSFAVDEEDLTLRPATAPPTAPIVVRDAQRSATAPTVPDGFLNPLPIDVVDAYTEQTITVRTVRRMLLAGGAKIFRGEVKHVCAGPEKLVRVNVRTLS